MNEFEIANRYVEKGRLHRKDLGDLSLFCYTKEEFFNKDDWDDVTLSHRGKLYCKGVPVGRPFEKIFNVGEHPTTSEDKIHNLLQTEDYVVMNKANGHLFIVDVFGDPETGEARVSYHTKGCIDPENLDMLKRDIEILHSTCPEQKLLDEYTAYRVPCTMMFESITDNDKHTLYDKQVEMYGENNLVLLGMYTYEPITEDKTGTWYNQSQGVLEYIARWLGVPVVKTYPSSFLTSENLNEAYDHKDTEGYVIWFPEIDFRVKIKTKEYWALRFKKEFTPDVILPKFRAGGVYRLQAQLPEEIADKVINAITLSVKYWHDMCIHSNGFVPEQHIKRTKKDIFTDDSLEWHQKTYINELIEGRSSIPRLLNNQTMRDMYVTDITENSAYKHLLYEFTRALQLIVDSIGQK